MKLIDRFRQIPMKRRPTATIRVVAEQPEEAAAATEPSAAEPIAAPTAASTAAPPIDPKFNRLPRAVIGIYIFTALSAVLYLVAHKSPVFADWFNRYISAAVRATTAHLTGWIPFSLAETLLLFLPVIIASLVIYAVRFRCDTWRTVFVYVGEILALVGVLLSLFIWSFGIAYRCSTLDKKLHMNRQDVSVEELEKTARILLDKVNELAPEVPFRNQDFSVMPYSIEEMNDKLLDAYRTVSKDLRFLQSMDTRLKPVINSELMSHAHITGVYTYFTGEANLNMVFPDYTIPYTAAHELAHQRGIAREDEANFIAFLVCIASDDPYIQYSGYLNMFEYVISALNGADSARYQAIFAELEYEVRMEEVASNAVNDTYLKLQGTPGAQSYGMVVDLAVAYYKSLT